MPRGRPKKIQGPKEPRRPAPTGTMEEVPHVPQKARPTILDGLGPMPAPDRSKENTEPSKGPAVPENVRKDRLHGFYDPDKNCPI